MHRTATRLLLRRRLAPPPAASSATRRYLSLGTASTLFAASASTAASGSTAAIQTPTTNTSVPLPTAMNGSSAETVAPVVDGHSKKMHSKVVSVLEMEDGHLQASTEQHRTSCRSSSALVQPDTRQPSTWPVPTSSRSCSKACLPTASPQEDSLQRLRMWRMCVSLGSLLFGMQLS